MNKVLRRPHNFIVRPAPGWSKIFSHELDIILRSPSSQYKFSPVVKHHVGRELKIANCDFRQGMEIASRLLSVHDVEWIVATSKCTSHAQLNRFMFSIPLADIVRSCSNVSDISVQCQAYKSFADSSSLLKESFQDQLTRVCTGRAGDYTDQLRGTRLRFRILLLNNIITLSASMSGADTPLYHRGYKHITSADNAAADHVDGEAPSAPQRAIAPLPEHHAAACFMSLLFTAPSMLRRTSCVGTLSPPPSSADTGQTLPCPKPILAGDADKSNNDGDSTGMSLGSGVAVGTEDRTHLNLNSEGLATVDKLMRRVTHIYVPFAGTGGMLQYISC